MSNDKLFPAERQQRILDKLKDKPKILVADLADEFGVSQFTVRGDLDALEKQGKLRRFYGGALSNDRVGVVNSYGDRTAQMSDEKRAIGRIAASYVEDGDIIEVDTGTTTIEMIRALPSGIHLTIVTNDFRIASMIDEVLPNARTLFLGGFSRYGFNYTYGSIVTDTLAPYRADKAFLSTNGFTIENGFTSEDADQAKIKRGYLLHAREKYVLFDSSKIGVTSFAKFADISEVNGIITNEQITDELTSRLMSANHDLRVDCGK